MLNDTEIDTWVTMIRVQAWINQRLAQDMLREDGVRITWYDVLIQLLHCEDPERGMRMQDLVDRVIISNSGMTRLIDRLVEKELVKRIIYEDDRREVYVILTETGTHLIQKLMVNHQSRIRHYFLQYFTEEELRNLGGYFQRVYEANMRCD